MHLKCNEALPIALLWIRVAPLKLSPFEKVFGSLDLEHESKMKQYVQHSGQAPTTVHPFQLGDRVLLKPGKLKVLSKLAKQWTSPCDILPITHSFPKLTATKPWIRTRG